MLASECPVESNVKVGDTLAPSPTCKYLTDCPSGFPARSKPMVTCPAEGTSIDVLINPGLFPSMSTVFLPSGDCQ